MHPVSVFVASTTFVAAHPAPLGALVTERLRSVDDEGFTLIELLVVIVIIGILVGLAVAVFLDQRDKGYDAAVRADLHNAATAEMAYFVVNSGYTRSEATLRTEGLVESPPSDYDGVPGDHLTIKVEGSNGFCLSATSAAGRTWIYNSEAGGLMPAGTVGCGLGVGGATFT